MGAFGLQRPVDAWGQLFRNPNFDAPTAPPIVVFLNYFDWMPTHYRGSLDAMAAARSHPLLSLWGEGVPLIVDMVLATFFINVFRIIPVAFISHGFFPGTHFMFLCNQLLEVDTQIQSVYRKDSLRSVVCSTTIYYREEVIR